MATAKETFAETGLDDLITVLEGDALTTLADLDGPVDFVLLDGWKEMYLPVIKLLEPRLTPGALVVADNTSMEDTVPYLDYVREPANGYVSVNFPAGTATAWKSAAAQSLSDRAQLGFGILHQVRGVAAGLLGRVVGVLGGGQPAFGFG